MKCSSRCEVLLLMMMFCDVSVFFGLLSVLFLGDVVCV